VKSMPIPDAIRRAALNPIGLAVLATLICATPPAAQTMNAVDTLAYINQRCENYSGEQYRALTAPVSLTGTRLAFQSRISQPREFTQYISFDLRRVDIAIAPGPVPDAIRGIQFKCGFVHCIDGRDMSRASHGDPQGNYKTGRHELACRDPERVARAFNHLQQLVGGRIADPVDPFAN